MGQNNEELLCSQGKLNYKHLFINFFVLFGNISLKSYGDINSADKRVQNILTHKKAQNQELKKKQSAYAATSIFVINSFDFSP